MRITTLITAATCCLALSSCFKDEPLNAECDITKAYVHTDNADDMFFDITDTLVEVPYSDSDISFTVKKKADITALSPMFCITEGATIEPASGSTHDFSNGPVIYTVTSEDGEWSRKYNVSFSPATRTVNDTLRFNFEDCALEERNQRYYVWTDTKEDGTLHQWATGNPGYMLSSSSALPADYPTAPLEEGVEGKGVKLETKSTGQFGALAGMRLAAGNLFIGKFDVSKALIDAMQATQFGTPFNKKPLKFTGYYKYRPGKEFADENGNVLNGRVDNGSIYSVVYRNRDAAGNKVVLHGDDVLTSPQIVAIAKVGDIHSTDQWTFFETEYQYTGDIDLDLLSNMGYSMAVVCSSSDEGAEFRGAIGSTLQIDKFSIICAEIEE